MSIFISYAHSDKEFAHKLAAQLVKHNAHVWVDTWELNVGDSILNKVQEAIQVSSALLVILSKASVQSEWCKKELSAGLMRELAEKRVVVLPVLIEDCEIPIFLREKMYADFRNDFELGLDAILAAVARVTNPDQGRIHTSDSDTDWAVDWGYTNDLFELHFTIIQSTSTLPFTLLTEVFLRCNEAVTRRYELYQKQGLGWLGRLVLTEALIDLADAKDLRVLLKDQFPQVREATLTDQKRDASYHVTIHCRRVGEDTGKDQILNISRYLKDIRDYVRNTSRQPSAEELSRLWTLINQPWKT